MRSAYRKSLEEQVVCTNRQLLKSQEEALQLRNLLKLLSQQYRKASMEERRELKTRQGSLIVEIENLKIHVKQLEALRTELEALLQLEQVKVKRLEEQLANSKDDSEEEKLRYERELQTLRETLLKESKEKLQQLETIMDRRVQDAIRLTREQVEFEYRIKIQQAIEKQQQKASTQLIKEREKVQKEAEQENLVKLQHAIEKEQRRATQELQQERKRLEQAVEKERVKMRKLIKALAIKEKKLIAEAEQKRQNVATTTTPSTSSPSLSSRTKISAAMMSPIKK